MYDLLALQKFDYQLQVFHPKLCTVTATHPFYSTGGPLDGLQDTTTGNGKTRTYADLVSRAAILDSSDERTYSEEVPSSTSAVGGMGASARENPSLSPKEDFSISPR